MSQQKSKRSDHLISDPSKPLLDLKITFSINKDGHYDGLDLFAEIRDDLRSFLCEGCSSSLEQLSQSVIDFIKFRISSYTGTQSFDVSNRS